MSAVVAENLLLAAPNVEIEASADQRPPRIHIVAYGGGVMRVPGWGAVAIDLAGLEIGGQVPLLADHDARVGGVVGHGQATVADGRLIVSGIMSGAGAAARQIIDMSAGGFSFQASVGVEPLEHVPVAAHTKVQINGRELASNRGFVLVKRGRLREVSITPLGADCETHVSIAASGGDRKEGTIMDTDVQVSDEQAIRNEERQRLAEVESLCQAGRAGWGAMQPKVDELKASAIAGELSTGELSCELLKILRDSRPQIDVAARRWVVSNDQMLEAALLGHMGLHELGEKLLGPQAMEQGQLLRATHALDICRAALMYSHTDIPNTREQLVRAALSHTSLPTALGNLANKLLLDSYSETPATWRKFCSVRSVTDFKPNTAIRPSYTGQLQQVAPGGEMKHGQADEWFTQYQVDTYGKLLSIDRRDLINDDLGVFDQASRATGRAAMRKVSDLAYSTLLGNAGGFFSAGNGNYLSGADSALSFDSLAEAIIAMMVQRDEEGNDLDLRPATLLVPPELQPTAKALLESEFLQQIAERVPTGNSLRRAVNIEVEPRLSNTEKFSGASAVGWYLFASPADVPMVMAFLNGRQQPTVEFFGLEQDVNRLAVTWRVYHDFGSALVDPRAAVRSKGQA